MKSFKFITRALIALLIPSGLLLAATTPVPAEATSPPLDEPLLAADDVNVTDAAPAFEPTAADPAAPAQASTATGASPWHLSLTGYLWFPGVHGDVGAFGRDVGFRASPSDLLSHFRLGLMGTVEARYERLVLTFDLIALRLAADNALPPPRLNAITANITSNTVLVTPKMGFRVIDKPQLKLDAMAGFRYWHFKENLSFSPGLLGLNYSASQNWISPIVGGRIEAPLSPKLAVVVFGDVGGWGWSGSQLEYQVGGVLSYKIKPKWTAQAGYRYLYVDYAGSGSGLPVVRTALSGVLIGLTRSLSKE